MSEVTIIIPGEVVPKQSVRAKTIAYFNKETNKCDAFLKWYQKKEITDYENKVKVLAQEQIGITFTPITGAIELEVSIIYGIPKGMTKTDSQFIAQGGKIYKTTLPDLTDNLLKGICDALQEIVYHNDGQICKVTSEKIYGFTEQAIITLRSIDGKAINKSLI